MVRKALNRLQWEASRQGARLGWPGAVGAVLILLAVGFQFAVVSRLGKEVEARRDEAARLSERYQMAITQPQAFKPGLSQQLGTFYEFFPPSGTLPDWLARMYEMADKRGVSLDRGEYKLIEERGWRLQRYQIILPVRGSYEQIRGFVADLLNEVPAAAVNEIGLKREGISATTLEAQIKLTLFFAPGRS